MEDEMEGWTPENLERFWAEVRKPIPWRWRLFIWLEDKWLALTGREW